MSIVSTIDLNLSYGKHHVLHDVTMDIEKNEITALIGPSGCGKSTFLKTLNRMNDLVPGCKISGEVLFDGTDIYSRKVDAAALRKKVGMVFQKANPFPASIYDNIAYAPKYHGVHGRKKLDEIVETSLRKAALWDEVKDRLKKSALGLSGGQQQRAALARMMAAEPKFLLLDEPFSALDAYLKEKLMQEMMTYLNQFKKGVIMVSHSRDEVYQMCSDTVIMHQGMIETLGKTKEIFDNPGTVNAARLTGCKNISRATKTGTHEVYASDWDIKLTFPEQTEIPSNLTHVGIRAHEIHPIVSKDTNLKDMDSNESIKLNTMDCQLERISEAPFEMYLILQNKSGKNTSPLWWKVTKKEWQEIGEKVPETVELPAEHIILLK